MGLRKRGNLNIEYTVMKPSRKPMQHAQRLILIASFLMIPAWADRPKIGLVLGGGGARGAAHIGVLKVIEKQRIPIDYIAGTSMGAIVGALYASGKSAAKIEEIFGSIDWEDALIDDGPRSEHSIRSKKNDVEFANSLEAGFDGNNFRLPTGLIQGQRLELLLRRLLVDTSHIKNFDELPIPFRAVATNLETMKPMVFRNGDLATTVRASMSVPGAFEPVHYQGMILVDGGIVDNVPVDAVMNMGADILIVVDVRTPLGTASELDSLGAILNQVIDGLMSAATDRTISALTKDDIYILPDLRDLGSADFPRTQEAIPWGEEAANSHLQQLQVLSMTPADFEAHLASRSADALPVPVIDQITIQHASDETQKTVNSRLSWQIGQPLDLDRLESSISEIYSEGSFSTIQYAVTQNEDKTSLNFNLKDKPWGPTIIEAALRVSDNFNGDSNYLFSVETITNNVNDLGAVWINRARLGLRTGLFSEFYQPLFDGRSYFVAPSVEYAAQNVSLRLDVERSLWRDQRGIFALDVGHMFGNHAEIRIGYEFGYADTTLSIGNILADDEFSFTVSQLTVEFLWDTLDDSAFPRRGLFLDAKINEPVESLGADAPATAYFFDVYKALKLGKGALVLGLSANGLSNDEAIPFQETNSLGGITRLSGYQTDELFSRHTRLLNAVYYRQLGGNQSILFDTPVYIGGSIEAGGVWFDRGDISTESMQIAGSIFAGIDSPIGPLYFGYGVAEGGISSLYLTIGSILRDLPRR